MKLEKNSSLMGIKEKKETTNTLEDIQDFFMEVFIENKNPEERLKAIKDEICPFLKHIDEEVLPNTTKELMLKELESVALITDKTQFINEAIKTIDPLIQIIEKDPKSFETAQAKAENEKRNFTPLNRLVSYSKTKDIIMLHHSVAYTIGPKRELYKEALEKLAEIIRNEKDEIKTKEIEAISWIVARIPKLFTNNGFDIQKSSSDDNEGREEAIAYISVEKFLERFPKK